jgi:3-dehydroquinate synthase
MVNNDTVKRQKNILTDYGLPTNDKNLNTEELLEAIQMDKKNLDGKVRWVLLRNIGEATIKENISLDVVKSSISKIIY